MIEEKVDQQTKKQYDELKMKMQQQINEFTTKLEARMHSIMRDLDQKAMQNIEELFRQKTIMPNSID